MAAVQNERKSLGSQKKEVVEMIELLEQLTEEEKREIKGIMIGIQISKSCEPVKTA